MTYIPEAEWSTPETGDPPPCFRQGDVVLLTYVRPDVEVKDASSLRISSIDVLNEPVALRAGSEASMAWARAMDDNYGGGDDNYPNPVVEMGAEERAEGRGRDRQK